MKIETKFNVWDKVWVLYSWYDNTYNSVVWPQRYKINKINIHVNKKETHISYLLDTHYTKRRGMLESFDEVGVYSTKEKLLSSL